MRVIDALPLFATKKYTIKPIRDRAFDLWGGGGGGGHEDFQKNIQDRVNSILLLVLYVNK